MGNMKPRRGREIPSEGWVVAYIAKLAHVGTQEDFNGDLVEQFVVALELAEQMSSGQNFQIWKTIAIKAHPKSGMSSLIKATGVATDEEGVPNARDLLGLPLYLEIIHKEKEGIVYANVGPMTRVPRGVEIPDPPKKTAYFWMDSDGFSRKALDRQGGQFPEWVIDKILDSEEYREFTAPRPKPPAEEPEPAPSPAAKPAAKGKAAKAKPAPKPIIDEELNDDFPETYTGKKDAAE